MHTDTESGTSIPLRAHLDTLLYNTSCILTQDSVNVKASTTVQEIMNLTSKTPLHSKANMGPSLLFSYHFYQQPELKTPHRMHHP